MTTNYLTECKNCHAWYKENKSLAIRKMEVFDSGTIVESEVFVSKCSHCNAETETSILVSKESVTA